jgi:DNA-binding CsgD family transcriptional regulator
MRHESSITFLPDDVWRSIAGSLGLSEREAQIARLLLSDDNREDTIAAVLAISPHTVHTHLERLYRKLGVTSRCHVVARIFRRYVEMVATSASVPLVASPATAEDAPRSRGGRTRSPGGAGRPDARGKRLGPSLLR